MDRSHFLARDKQKQPNPNYMQLPLNPAGNFQLLEGTFFPLQLGEKLSSHNRSTWTRTSYITAASPC